MSDITRPYPAAMRRLILAFLTVGFLAVYAIQAQIDKRPARVVSQETLYISSPQVLKSISLGMEGLLADIYWLRAIQYYGAKRKEMSGDGLGSAANAVGSPASDLLEPLLDIATSLDPEMIDAYRFGAVFLSEPYPLGLGDVKRAVKLLDKGLKHNPQAWQFYFDKGFIYLWHARDFKRAGEIFLEGSRNRQAPGWLADLAAYALTKGGDLEMARYLWLRRYEDAENEAVRRNALNHLLSIQVDEDIWRLEHLISRYGELKGRRPASLDELIAAGLLKGIPSDPSGIPYRYDPGAGKVYLSPRSTVRHFPLPDEYRERYLAKLAATYR